MITLGWNFDKPYYSPSDKVRINLWLENRGTTHVSISEIAVEFQFMVYDYKDTICGTVPPANSDLPNMAFLGTAEFTLPFNIVGTQVFNLRYVISEWIDQNWVTHPIHKTPEFIINIYSTPVYKVFISRGLRPEDRLVGNQIQQMIEEWGFDPVTIGINVHVPEHLVLSEVENQIQNSEGLIVIATPRILDHSSLTWYTLEWLHGETALAYAERKPILILKDKNVKLGGLSSYLDRGGQLEYDPMNLYDLKTKLSLIMPKFRVAIEKKKTDDFIENLKNLVIDGLAVGGIVLVSGIIGSIIDSKIDL